MVNFVSVRNQIHLFFLLFYPSNPAYIPFKQIWMEMKKKWEKREMKRKKMTVFFVIRFEENKSEITKK